MKADDMMTDCLMSQKKENHQQNSKGPDQRQTPGTNCRIQIQ